MPSCCAVRRRKRLFFAHNGRSALYSFVWPFAGVRAPRRRLIQICALLNLRNIFRVAFLLSCHIFDCDGNSESRRDLLFRKPAWQVFRVAAFQRQLWYHISDRLDCQALFLKFLRTFRFPFSSARPFLTASGILALNRCHCKYFYDETNEYLKWI